MLPTAQRAAGRAAAWLVAAAIAGASSLAARADEPTNPAPPARHENKISAEAKAAFERIEKVTYPPGRAGLKDLTGKLESKMDLGAAMGGMEGMEGMGEMPGMTMTYTVTFKAPQTVTVETKGTQSTMFPQDEHGGGDDE